MIVSVIIPTHNAEGYIITAINSVLNQSFKDIDIIVVDDGSTDKTKELLNTFIKENRIRYYYKENGGVASARNFGIKKAKGDYIAFLDADDLYHFNKLERQLSVFQSYPDVHIVYNDVNLIDDNNNKIGILKSEEIIDKPENFFAKILYRQIIPAPASMMLKRECIDDGIRFPKEYTHAEDYSFTIRLAEKYSFFYLDESLYYYRRHSRNLTNNHKLQMNNEKAIVKELGIKRIKQIVASTTYPEVEKKILLVKILLKIEEYESALYELDKVQFDDFEYYFVKGVLNYYMENYYQAIDNFKISISIEERAEGYNNIGCCLVQLNNTEKSLVYFKKASQLRNHYTDPIYNLAAIDRNKNVKITEKKLRKDLTIYKA